MSDRWTESISEYLDGGLVAAQRRLFESRARALPLEGPQTDLWPGIEARIQGAGPVARPMPAARRGGFTARRFSFSLPQLAAACLALAVLSGGAVWYGLTLAPSRVPGIAAGRPASGTTPASLSAPDHVAIQDVEELGRVLAAGR